MPVKKPLKKSTPSVAAAKGKNTPTADSDKPEYTVGQTLEYKGYCVKCKEKDAPITGVVELAKNGSLVAKGPHSCGTKVCRILGKPRA